MKILNDEVREIYRDEIMKIGELRHYFTEGLPGIRDDIDGDPFDMRFYQVEGADLLCDMKRVLIADEMGAGKTLQAIAGKMMIENRNGKKAKTLVITPNSVKDHWYEEIRRYCDEDRAGNVLKMEGCGRGYSLDNYDFVILNYDVLSFGENGNKQRLKKALLEAGFNYTVLDEVHNAKNPAENAFRSKNVKEIADASEYLCMLSGTPIPNTLSDTYMLISLLEPHVYRTPRDVAARYALRPDLIKVVLGNRMLRRQMKDIKGLPELSDSYHWIEFGPEQKRLYESIYRNNYLEGSKKLEQLRLALLEPPLVDRRVVDDDSRLILDMESMKFQEIDRLLGENIERGEKTVIFSPVRRRGITRKLEARYRDYGALRMDGTNLHERGRIQELFQEADENRVLTATNVAGEGISLTSASRCIFVEDPYTHAERDQMIKRLHRPGQTRPVHALTIAVPETMDQGVKELIEEKRRIADFILEGERLSPEEIAVYSNSRTAFFETATKRWLYTPQQYVMRMSNRMAGKPEKAVIKAVNHTQIGKKYADNYCIGWEESFQANVAEVYKRLINAIEEREGKLGRKLDLASAFGVLSYVTGEKATNIDINMHHFLAGMAKKDNNNITASMSELPLKDESYDLALCSLSLHHPENDSRRMESVRETNRVLRKGGYYMMTLHSYLVGDLQRLDDELFSLGFETIPELSGFVESRRPENLGFSVYVHTARKVRESGESCLTLATEGKRRSIKRDGKVTEFCFADKLGNKESFDERLERYVKNKA
jgi:superfamily II DNA or RNA helicase